MQLYWLLFTAIVLIGIYAPCEGIRRHGRFQKFIENFVDIDKFKQEGISSINTTDLKYIWTIFKTKFPRHYSSSEEKQRIGIFRDNLKHVLESNINKTRKFQLAMNNYSDWTAEEFNAVKKGLVVSTSRRRHIIHKKNNAETVQGSLSKLRPSRYHSRRLKRNLYDDNNEDKRQDSDSDSNSDSDESTAGFDWRTMNVVTSIKDQGNCGSCYSFATAAVMESAYAIKTSPGNLTDFSPQQIVDCSTSENNYGCNGGNFIPSVDYLTAQGSNIATYASYPYTGTADTCQTDNIIETDLGNIEYTPIPSGDEVTMASQLVNTGPMYIAINADTDLFMYYSSGVLSVENCANSLSDLDHAVVAVGYGYDDTVQQSYWIVKNSWGTDWGENGYVRIAKDAGNMCGVATEAYATTLT